MLAYIYLLPQIDVDDVDVHILMTKVVIYSSYISWLCVCVCVFGQLTTTKFAFALSTIYHSNLNPRKRLLLSLSLWLHSPKLARPLFKCVRQRFPPRSGRSTSPPRRSGTSRWTPSWNIGTARTGRRAPSGNGGSPDTIGSSSASGSCSGSVGRTERSWRRLR